jgi:hypothetical protein
VTPTHQTVARLTRVASLNKRYAPALLIAATVASKAFCATGTLIVFDDADENGFSRPNASCSNGSSLESVTVHSGSTAVYIPRMQDNNGAGWAAPSSFSASADYDGITFWINAGSSPTVVTSLGVYDADNTPHFLHLEDVYGAALPANTWIQFQIPFSSPYFEANSYTPPATVQTVCVISHSSGAGYYFLDDVALTGADIFKDGFEN